MSAFQNFAVQAFHYFSRPHSHVPTGLVVSDADWRGPDMAKRSSEWLIELNADQIAEIGTAADRVLANNIPMLAVDQSQFSLPSLADAISGWRKDIMMGRGFVVIRGLPVAIWGEEKSAMAYWGLGHQLGRPSAQNPQDELLGHVVDYGEEKDNPVVRRYRTTGHIDFHCDAADAVGLLCLHTAKSGGQSRIVSSVAIFNEIYRRGQELIPRLFEPFLLDRRDEQAEGEPGYLPIPPCRYDENGILRTFYHSEYFRSVERFDEIEIDAKAKRVLDLYDRLCLDQEFQLDMWLKPGDMQFISNHTVVHSRTAYEDWSERERKRHLLRLWLSF